MRVKLITKFHWAFRISVLKPLLFIVGPFELNLRLKISLYIQVYVKQKRAFIYDSIALIIFLYW